MSSFDEAIDYVLKSEGGLEEDQDGRDPAGISKYGISLRLLKSLSADSLRKYGIAGTPQTINADTIRDLTLEQAKSVYKGEFWARAPFGAIINQDSCNYIFDMAINQGIAPAIKCAQRACWAVQGIKDVTPDDGVMGEDTIDLINRNSVYLLPAMRSERAGDYRMIIVMNPKEKEFLNGWLSRAYGS